MQVVRMQKDFEIKKVSKYYDLYFQSDTLLLADVFENLKNMCLEKYDLNPSNFFPLLD